MKERLKYITGYYIFWLLLFVAWKPVFLLFHWKNSFNFSIVEWGQVALHGFSMDLSAAAYITTFIAILLFISCFFRNNKWLDKIIYYYTIVMLFITLLLCVADLYLYSFWGFRIDLTPLFYLQSPKNALASGTWGMYLTGILLFAFLCFVAFRLFRKFHQRFFIFPDRSIGSIFPLAFIMGILFVFIRGGLGTSTMNTGWVYFSKAAFLNHAAINPVWNFMYSFGKEQDFDKQYRFMEAEEAAKLFEEMTPPAVDSTTVSVLKTDRPNIIFIIFLLVNTAAVAVNITYQRQVVLADFDVHT
jgi:hypothetical protein